MGSESRTFLAGRRCFKANGIPSLILFGLSPHTESIHEVLEDHLLSYGVCLGDFLTATLTFRNTLENFKKISYPIDVSIDKNDKNFAVMEFPTAEVRKDDNCFLVFQTKSFGPVRSVNQKLPLGFYHIAIKSIDSTTNYNITLCAEAIATSQSPTTARYSPSSYELPNNHQLSHGPLPSELRESLLPTAFFGVPKPPSGTAKSDNYAYISSSKPEYRNSLGLERKNCTSSVFEPPQTISELIDKLPKIDLNQPPTPKPRTVVSKPQMKQTKVKPVMKVEPNKMSAFPQNPIDSSPKVMKAFVVTIGNDPYVRTHFLWICDIMQTAILKLRDHVLEIGHFFEGVFEKQPNGWCCVKYEKQISRLINGNMVFGRIELITTISKYQPDNEKQRYPCAYAKYLGLVIDRHSKLPPDCNGKRVKIQRRKFDEIQYGWVITGLA